MFRMLAIAALAAAVPLAGLGEAVAADGKCRLIRTLKDGRVMKSMIDENSSYASVSRSSRGVRASSASSSDNASSASSVSVSSSSSSSSSSSRSGGGSARAESTRTDSKGRKITVISDDDGCTVRVDERNT